MNDRLRRLALWGADAIAAAIPRRVPPREALKRCKIISHRGEHDNVLVAENTLPAFERAVAAGVWGIECDVRWTADLVPVICHDPTADRVFGKAVAIGELTLSELRSELPGVPLLGEVVSEFAHRAHLMLELKADPVKDPDRQVRALEGLLGVLEPVRQYHLLALDPVVFELVPFAPRECRILVAEENMRDCFSLCLRENYGGLSGHFLLLDGRMHRQLTVRGKHCGTGFIGSRNALFRELNRGVEWIFSNDAVRLQRIRDDYLQR